MAKAKTQNSIMRLVYAALCLALALVLPFLTGQIPKIGNMLCPMHFPILLCGLICGWQYGAVTGFIAPILRSMIFGVPPIMPKGISMAFELAAYGLIAGILYANFKNKKVGVYVSLISAMLAGRIVWAVMRMLLAGVSKVPFSYAIFIADGFVDAIPGIIAQIVIIPLLVFAIESAGLGLNKKG